MMAIDQRQIDAAIASQPTPEQSAAIDRVLAEHRRISRLRALAAIRTDDDSPWLALEIAFGKEMAVEESMSEHGIEALIPMRMGKERRRRRQIIPAKLEPIMVGYSLARCIITNDTLHALLSFDGVKSVVGGCDQPHLIGSNIVRTFKQKATTGHYDYERPAHLFRIGNKVTIKEGIFANFTGQIVTCNRDGKGDAVVEISMFGGLTPAIVPLAMLEVL